MEDSADADLGIDLVGGDFHLKLGGVAAITFARDVLRVVSGQRKIAFRQGRTDARGQSKTDVAYKWTDSSHYDSPTFSTRDCRRLMQRANAGLQKGGGQRAAVAWER